MKPFRTASCLVAAALAFGMEGCKKKEPQADASQPLQQSFQTAAPEVQKAVAMATTSLKAGNYTEATRALAPIVDQHRLTGPQKQAVGVALQQINQAITANPALDTKEMYEMRAKMFEAMRRGSRF